MVFNASFKFAAALLLTSSAAFAAGGEERCAIFGPLTISAWVGTIQELGGKSPSAAGSAAARLNDMMEIYERMECPKGPMLGTLECMSDAVLKGWAPQGDPSQLAGICMRQTGMPGAPAEPRAQ